MTKTVFKWYHKFAWWQVAIFFITPIAGGGEIAIAVNGLHWGWHFATGFAGALLAALRYFGKDEDGDGIVDVFQKDETP